jgi:hypothetical protein
VAQDNVTASKNAGGRYRLTDVSAWPTERWAAVIVLGALGTLILIRMGFRGVNVLGASASIG